jgi:hypothetical protein
MIEAVLRKGREPDAERKACADCRHCKGAVSWWCKNPTAVRENRTSIPMFKGCRHWEPCRTQEQLGFFERWFDINILIVDAGKLTTCQGQ